MLIVGQDFSFQYIIETSLKHKHISKKHIKLVRLINFALFFTFIMASVIYKMDANSDMESNKNVKTKVDKIKGNCTLVRRQEFDTDFCPWYFDSDTTTEILVTGTSVISETGKKYTMTTPNHLT